MTGPKITWLLANLFYSFGFVALMTISNHKIAIAETEDSRDASTTHEREIHERKIHEREIHDDAKHEHAEHHDAGVMVITATRLEESPFDAPFAITHLSSKTLQERGFRTTPESLRDIPSVMVQKTAHGQGSPYIRGFTGFHNVFLIDGIRLNNSTFRSGPNQYWNTVDNFSIGSYEVLRGLGAVQWGSDAIGGTVNAITLNPYSSSESGGFHWAGRSILRLSSAEHSVIARQEISAGVGEEIGVIGGITLKDFGDLESGGGNLPDTGYTEWDADFKIVQQVSREMKLIFAYQHVEQNNVPRTHRTVNAVPFEGSTVGTDIQRDLDHKRDLVYLQLHLDDIEDSWLNSGKISISWHRQQEVRDRIRSSLAREVRGFDVHTIGLWAQFDSPMPIGHILYGYDFYHDEVDSFDSTNTIQGPVADDATYDTFSLFAQWFIPVQERIEIILGTRYSYARADADRVQDPDTSLPIAISDSWQALVGNARMLVSLDSNDTIHFYSGLSQGFRAPTLSDLTRFGDAATGQFEIPSPGLSPERFISSDIGFKLRNENTQAEVSYYLTNIRDMIVRTPTGDFNGTDAVVSKQNIGDGWVHGVEVAASHRINRNFTVFGNLTWMNGRVDAFPTATSPLTNEPIDRLMPLTGQLGARFNIPDEWISLEDLMILDTNVPSNVHLHGAWIEVVGLFADRQDTLSTRDADDTSRIPPGGTPGYAIMSIRSGVKIGEYATLNLAIENVFDKNYRVHGSGINEPGRNFIAFLELLY